MSLPSNSTVVPAPHDALINSTLNFGFHSLNCRHALRPTNAWSRHPDSSKIMRPFRCLIWAVQQCKRTEVVQQRTGLKIAYASRVLHQNARSDRSTVAGPQRGGNGALSRVYWNENSDIKEMAVESRYPAMTVVRWYTKVIIQHVRFTKLRSENVYSWNGRKLMVYTIKSSPIYEDQCKVTKVTLFGFRSILIKPLNA
jgi:hypothetical protein